MKIRKISFILRILKCAVNVLGQSGIANWLGRQEKEEVCDRVCFSDKTMKMAPLW